ncbi:PREDICTED: endonuclease G, mitochondrial isoform X2 [Dinoponera quadriceps]|uniref:Endonuclease n=1 Tax=Dinoponera quadriceps TaxID=609295 RepID=A0A6P3XXR7_DINQU|nr:PREDICTED: endonuclease G, mitochondrial isoform X2 [Dinoponera quadriceps]
MNSMSRVTLNLVTLSSVGLGGWYLGKFSERKRCSNEKDNGTIKFSKARICNMPALPLFGTVTAATPLTPVENKPEMGSKISSTAARISQVRTSFNPFFEKFKVTEENLIKLFTTILHDLGNIDRSENTDYKGSGYDRGHLAAAGNHKVEQKHMEQTFFLSNMAPQVGVGFNRDSWNRLEKYVRKLTNIYKDVYVCTGPLYLPKKEADGKKYVRYEVIGVNNVAVPTHFYKVIVGETKEGKLEMEAFVMPNMPVNDNTPLTNFQVPPETIERAAGLLFFDKISRDKLSKVNGKNTG